MSTDHIATFVQSRVTLAVREHKPQNGSNGPMYNLYHADVITGLPDYYGFVHGSCRDLSIMSDTRSCKRNTVYRASIQGLPQWVCIPRCWFSVPWRLEGGLQTGIAR